MTCETAREHDITAEPATKTTAIRKQKRKKKKERRLKTLDEEAVLTAGEKHTSTTLQSFSVERYGKESNT